MNEEIQIEQSAELLKILAHPLRLRILKLLHERTALNVSAIQQQLSTDQGALSQHLIKLKDRGILTSRREGKLIYYLLADNPLTKGILLLLGW